MVASFLSKHVAILATYITNSSGNKHSQQTKYILDFENIKTYLPLVLSQTILWATSMELKQRQYVQDTAQSSENCT